MNGNGAVAAGGGIKSWWQNFNLERWFGEASSDAVQVAISFVAFFAVGFLFKKYLKFIFFCLVMSVILIVLLDYYKFLDVDWEAIFLFLGLPPDTTFGTLSGDMWVWIKAHWVVVTASSLGFLLGYKLG